jgi:hypothetical protein
MIKDEPALVTEKSPEPPYQVIDIDGNIHTLYESEIYEISFVNNMVEIDWYESDEEREEFAGEPSQGCRISGEEAMKLLFAIKMRIAMNQD